MKQVGYYHVFPFQDIEQGSSIVIWGMGEVGQHYLKQVLQTGYCEIEYAVDKNWQKHKEDIVKVMPVYAARRASEGARIVIAIGNDNAAGEIRQQLRDWGIENERIVWNDTTIGESMVVSDQPTQREQVVKRIGYYHIFPFHRVEKGETVLLWGMGEVGRHYALQLQKTGYAQVEYAVDSKWQGVENAPVEVKAPGLLARSEGMKVIIANGSGQAAEAIKGQLRGMGIPEERILWDDIIVNSELVVQEQAGGASHKFGTPYLYGSESGVNRRSASIYYGIDLSDYDVVSLNIFEVLVFRRFKDRGVFYEIVGDKLGCRDFAKLRTEAESQARKKLEEAQEFRDPALEDIYALIEWQTGIEVNQGCQTEIETEMEWCMPNPFFREAYDVLLHNKKKVIFLEDTCLSSEVLARILKKCGYKAEAEDIYASCECYATKRGDGSLFQLAKNELGQEKRYCHVGFYPALDITQARNREYKPYFYMGVHDIGNKYRATGMSEMVNEAYRMLVNRELHQDRKVFSVPYEYGFIYGGLLALGFGRWLSRSASFSSFDKVIFLSSDGRTLREIYRKMPHEVEDRFLYWSETASLRLMAKKERKPFLDKVLYNISWDRNKLSVREYFEKLHLESLISKRGKYPFNVWQEMNGKIAQAVGGFLADHWDEVAASFEEEAEAAGKYVREVAGEAERIAIVDVNGYGENGALLAKAMNEKWGMSCHAEIFTMGSKNSFSAPPGRDNEMGSIHAYCFDRAYQRELHKFHFAPKGRVPLFFSLLWGSDEPELAGFINKNGRTGFAFSAPLVENYPAVRDIQKGIREFCRRYYSQFSGYSRLMDISGRDAYMPFKSIAAHGKYLEDHYGSYILAESFSPEWTDMVPMRELLAAE